MLKSKGDSMAKRKIRSSTYYSDKGFVYIGTGLLSILTRFIYIGNTLYGKIFLIFGIVMCLLGVFNIFKYYKCRRIEKNCEMTMGYAIHLINGYIVDNIKRTDIDTIQLIRAMQFVLDYLDGQGYKEEAPNTISLNSNMERVEKQNDCVKDTDNTINCSDSTDN